MTIPVICDRCRATGLSGAGEFSHLGDLLAFEPVPRKTNRVDGWTAERQRAFIAALSATGSKRQAAMAIGMAAFGVDQLLKAPGNAAFAAAYDRALEIARANGSMKIARGVADAAARNAVMVPPSRLRDLPPAPDEEDSDHELKLEILDRLLTKYQMKLHQERELRLAGNIAEADFTLRQVTAVEIGFELLAEHAGTSAVRVLMNLQRGGYAYPYLAATPMTRMLDAARREAWAALGEPTRPDPVDRSQLIEVSDGPYRASAQPGQALGRASRAPPGVDQAEWSHMTVDEQTQTLDRLYARAAEDQIEWERRAQEAREASEHGARAQADRAQEAWEASEHGARAQQAANTNDPDQPPRSS